MITIIFVSDIHSNLEALQAVFADVDDEVGDEDEVRTYCLGDIVGYGASPNEVIELLRDNNAVCISGNHDQAALSGDVASFNPFATQALQWTFSALDAGSQDFLKMLPTDVSFEVGRKKVFLVHGSPDDPTWGYADMATHSELFGEYLTNAGADFLGMGHTHVPYVWRGPEGTVFNPGSVGQPRDGDRRASYATLTMEEMGGMQLQHRRIDYDVETSARKIKEAGLPPQLGDRLFLGQ